MEKNITREEYLQLLKDVYEREKRYPKKSDFSVEDVMRIKSFFGPWPHALAAAGIIESKEKERVEKNRRRRAAAKEKRKSQ